MSNSYRIRTQPGVDKSIKILIDQEFEYLEILSLKLLQSQIYTRQCSDYGVVVGRVSVNNGFGLPNAKVSVFIPLTSTDELDPVISDLYPYKTLNELNEDGYRYNLLPYKQSHSGHVPTGTFFDRLDVLVDPTLIEVYDKYYKYTTVTNSSGDYMIFGVPVGSQTIVMDVDLSDIGEFSLSPQDLIRMGVATPNQVAGTKFKSSKNLRELPQLITINKTIQVEPLWGQPEICNLGITRTDFDLSGESNIDIRPTAIFMGSIVSSNDGEILARNCKPKFESGSLCSLVTGPGEILAIRQTVEQDSYGRPILETVDLEEGGQVIDDNGTWLVDVPMNLDYLITNEFGEQVISDDPKKGIPTKGKYRFKVKWNQSPSLSETTRRAYFLVPNIREYGWSTANNDPNKTTTGTNNIRKSYAFSLNWDDYADFQSAIDCTDTFYLMQYNKVYTVSQLIDQYRKGYLNSQFIGIKNILDDSCESDNNKFPTNDGVFRFDLIYFLFWIMLFLFRPIFYILIPVVHILWFVLKIYALLLSVIISAIMTIVIVICNIFKAVLGVLGNLPKWLGGRYFRRKYNSLKCITFADIQKMINDVNSFPDKLTNIKIPNLSYPECSFCDCGNPNSLPKDDKNLEQLSVDESNVTNVSEAAGTSLLTAFQIPTQYDNKKSWSGSTGSPGVYTIDGVYQELFAGTSLGNAEDESFVTSTRIPFLSQSTNNDEVYPTLETDTNSPEFSYFTSSLTIAERLNLFNTKAKYFNEGPLNPGGGVNRIKVTFQPDLNTNATTDFHYDNVIAIVCTNNAKTLESGTIVSFQDSTLSKDLNVINSGTTLNNYGTNSITGDTINTGTSSNPATISVNYAKPDGSGNETVSYKIVAANDDALYAKFPTDIEYYQVITGMTYSSYKSMCNTTPVNIINDWDNNNSFNNRFLSNDMVFYRVGVDNSSFGSFPCIFTGPNLVWSTSNRVFKPIDYYKSYENQIVIFLVRGVDPNSSRTKVKYDLSRLFGYNFSLGPIIVGDKFKLNHPINGTLNCVNHITTNNIVADYYYDSFHFKPSQSGDFSFSSFTTNLHTFYSKLDSLNSSFKPGNTSPTLGAVTTSSISRLPSWNNSVQPPYDWSTYVAGTPPTLPTRFTVGTQGKNHFTVEWDKLYVFSGYCSTTGVLYNSPLTKRAGNINNTPIDNRGYYPNEIVEGGSMFYQEINITQQYKTETPLSITSHYYAPKYSSGNTLTMTLNSLNPTKIVMRSDRLPTSTTLQDNINNSFALHSNTNFSIYIISDDGGFINQNTDSTGSGLINSDGAEAYSASELSESPAVYNEVVESFNCGNMAPLPCYYNEGSNIKIRPKGHPCWNFGGSNSKFNGGCYALVSKPIISLIDGSDFRVLTEWTSRVQTIFGACRNVFSHIFTNNWVNGTLYAFSFSNDVVYNSQNKPSNRYCKDTLFFDDTTNNFYYRSSPWNSNTLEFIGSERPQSSGVSGGILGGYGGNWNNLKFPTTIMDLGPRVTYLQELVMSDDFDGYVLNKLNSTTYGDVSELLNMLIITRLANESFLSAISGQGILTFFSRTKLMVDGDYSQMLSINSELGVAQFQSINYPDNPPGEVNPVYYSTGGGGIDSVVFGVFFSSNTQTRDFISPKRTIITPKALKGNSCGFNNFSVFTQVVPFYQWRIQNNPSIFGNQKNEWNSKPIYDGTGFFSHPYQLLDRMEPSSRYMNTIGNFENQYFKGYIYSVKQNGQLDYESSSIQRPIDEPTSFTTGAPFHFYFGLKKGKSAFDRFTTKWIDTTITLQ